MGRQGETRRHIKQNSCVAHRKRVNVANMKKLLLAIFLSCVVVGSALPNEAKEREKKFNDGINVGWPQGVHISAIRFGVATFASGVATVVDANVKTGTVIWAQRLAVAGTSGVGIAVVITAGTGFTLTSQTAGALTTQTSDTSTVSYLEFDP